MADFAFFCANAIRKLARLPPDASAVFLPQAAALSSFDCKGDPVGSPTDRAVVLRAEPADLGPPGFHP